MRELLDAVCKSTKEGGLGYRAVVVNFRGCTSQIFPHTQNASHFLTHHICAGVPVTSPRLYSAGTTDDLRVALMYLTAVYPESPLLGVGFSLGASVLAKYLAEEGIRSRLKAACVLGCVSHL